MKVLIISFYFLPSICANSKRPYYLARGLSEAGWEVDVLASNSLIMNRNKQSFKHHKYNIVRIDDPQEILYKKGLKNTWYSLISKSLRAVLWPDAFILWSAKISKGLDLSKYDRIITFIMPISSLLIPYIKGIDHRWFFDYSESFSSSSKIVRKSPIIQAMKPLLNPLQRRLLKQAGGVIFNSNSTLLEYRKAKLLKNHQGKYIPNFYDQRDFTDNVVKTKKFVIEYAGQLGEKSGRSSKIFLKALHLFLKRQPHARTSTIFSFHGIWDNYPMQLIAKYKLQDIVKIYPPVSHKNYISCLQKASILLLIASSIKKTHIPGKLYDYLGANRPILAFLPNGTETEEILNEALQGEYISGENDVSNGITCLETLWNKWSNNKLMIDHVQRKKWSYSTRIPEYIDYITNSPESNE